MMMRSEIRKERPPRPPPRAMRPTPNRLPRRKGIIVYDIESKKASPSLFQDSEDKGFERAFLVTIYDGEHELALRNEANANSYPWDVRAISPGGCVDRAMAFLLAPRYRNAKYRIYARNGGKFDHLFILGWLKLHSDEYCFEVCSVQSRIQRLDIWRRDTLRKKLCWSFCDSWCVIPLSLKEAGKTFCGHKEQKLEFDLDTPEASKDWEKYGIQDVRTDYFALFQFHTLVESLGGEVGLTAPSTAVRLFQRRYLKCTLYRHTHFSKCSGTCDNPSCERRKVNACDGKCHNCLHEWIFRGYYGGRSEVFARKGRGLYYFDINSSYPRSMMEAMPIGKKVELDNPSLLACQNLARKGYIGFLDCDVHIPDNCTLPPLPSKRDGKLVFVVGKLSGVWAMAELSLLDEPEVNGKIVKIRKAVFYESAPIFRDMVTDIYRYRDKHRDACENVETCKGCRDDYDEGMSFVAKLILNSLYGKFGMSPARDVCAYVPPGEEAPEHARPMYGQPEEDEIWIVPYFVDVDYMIPQIAAYITSLARIRLFRGFLYALRMGFRVFYADTDAMVVDGMIATGSKLGQWKREQDYGKRLDGDFLLPKLYRLAQHHLDCQDDECKGCALVYHHSSCPRPKAAKAKDCEFCNRAASVQHMKGIPGRLQTGEAFQMLLEENDLLISEKAGESVKRKKADYLKLPVERVMQHRTILRSWGSKKGSKEKPIYLGPKLVESHKAHRTVYDKRHMREDGTSIPFRVEDW